MRKLICLSHILHLCFMLHSRVQCSSLSPSSTNSRRLCLPKEQFALLDFKSTTNVDYDCDAYLDGRPTMETWNRSIDCCMWEGITCDKMNGHVIGLDLTGSCIAANLTTNSSLFRLEKLQSLNLAYNDFRYPNSFGFYRWKSLTYLNLTGTRLIHSSLLCEMSLLPELVSLDLSFSDLLLEDPKFQMLAHNLTKLRHLILESVNMSLVLPTSLLNLTSSLEQLSLKDSSLQGNFPSQNFQLPSLQLLDLSGNINLRGTLPKSNWSSPLKYSYLHYTSFSGELPYSLGNLKLLEEFSIYDCQYSGPIPTSLANLTEITYLSFGLNHLEGQIPDVFGKMHKLSILALEANNFGGEVPASIFNLTHLTCLIVSSNKLMGPFPNNVSGLSSLSKLLMYDNLIKVKVPSWLFTLPSLVHLDLSHNKLMGPISHIQNPSLILDEVHLSNNEISGSIPVSFFDLVNLSTVDLSSNNLSGTITPNMLSKLVDLETLDLSNNSFLSLSSDNVTGVNLTFPTLNALILSSCNIHKFPSFLRKARSLEALDISKNKISSKIHKWEIEGMSLRMLNLSYNFLSGIDLFGLKNLITVDLRSNKLQGSLPVPPPTSGLMHFFISMNSLIGEIPSSLCNLTSLVVLDLSWNSLEGEIPDCVRFFTELSVIDLRMNKLHGRIPNSFVNNNKLRTLNLNGNHLEWALPPSLVNCSSLEVLDVGNNYLNGTFPHWLGVLPRLQVLILRSNRFHGSISNSMTVASNFSQLSIIDISQNEFEGLLPTKYFQNFKGMKDVPSVGKAKLEYIGDSGNYYEDSVMVRMKDTEVELVRILTIFTTIDFSCNRFYGQIPEELGELNSLLVLNFSYNSLIGQIPSSLGKLTALESLDLSSNKLDGRIPEQLISLTFLSVLDLSHNQLAGQIPQGKQFDTFSNDSYIGNLGLCGFPLTKKCKNEEEPESPPSKINGEDHFAALFDWKFALAGCGCGFVLGLSVGYIVFTIGRPWWLVKKVEEYQQKLVGKCNGRHKKRTGRKPNQHP